MRMHVYHDNNSSAKGLGFTGALQIAFIVLKLCGVINWSWWLVMLPAIISVGLVIFLFLLMAIFIMKE